MNTGSLTLSNGNLSGNGAGAGAGGDGQFGTGAYGVTNSNLSGSANFLHTGGVSIAGTATQGQTLTASNTLADGNGMGTVSYQWLSDGANISGAASSTFVLTQAQVGHLVTVTGSYTDGGGFADSATSSPTSSVAALNSAPTGSVTIGGTATQGQTLTASNSLADADGLGDYQLSVAVGRRRHRRSDRFHPRARPGQVGHVVTVVASYTDGQSTAESVGSAPTASVANINDAPTGVVSIAGVATQGQTLTASNTLADPDGLGTISYQWRSAGVDIGGATGSTLVLAQAQVGHAVTVIASYTDLLGAAEVVGSPPTASVANINDAPTGAVSIAGTATQGQTLTASNTLADADGLGTISYQWQSAGVDIGGATGSTLVLGQAQVGDVVTVVAGYTDNLNTAESVGSAPTTSVANVNDAPTGSVSIAGTATQGQTLTASNTLADADGLGAISYQWQSGGIDIGGATASTLVLGQALVGHVVTVVASYTDSLGTPESVSATGTSAVANINDVHTGSVSIAGTATQGQTLTASNTLADADGLGTIMLPMAIGRGEHRRRHGSQPRPRPGSGRPRVTVVASYTDSLGTAESATATGTSAVANVNDAPTGLPTISGSTVAGSTLTVVTSGIADPDGLGTFSYAWKSDGAPIGGATAATFTLGQAQVGHLITVTAATSTAAPPPRASPRGERGGDQPARPATSASASAASRHRRHGGRRRGRDPHDHGRRRNPDSTPSSSIPCRPAGRIRSAAPRQPTSPW